MPEPLSARVATVESQVQTLQELPGQVAELTARVNSLESQFFQFRTETKAEFLQFRAEVKDEFRVTRNEIRAGDEETRRYMRVLYEDLVSRLKIINEK